MSKKNCKSNELNIAVLDTRVKAIEHFVEEINDNHLPHIYKRLNSIDKTIAFGLGGLAVLQVVIMVIIKFWK